MRGQTSEVGATRVSANGYHYTKTEKKWKLTHHLIAEKMLGRELREDERVSFIGSKKDLRPENIRVTEKGQGSMRRRLAQLETRIKELEAERDELLTELREPRGVRR